MDSPNVRYGLLQKKRGIKPTNEMVVAGVLSYNLYLQRRKLWDEARQCVGLDGEFYEGTTNYMYPKEWLGKSIARAAELPRRRAGLAMGVDSAEGGDDSAWAIIDDDGLIYLHSEKTPDTTYIPRKTVALMREFNIPAESVIFDQGGGGGIHVDTLRSMGHNVREVSFGESPGPEPVYWKRPWDEVQEGQRERYNYFNRRSQMYHLLRQAIDPYVNASPFAIPSEYEEVIRQMRPIPLDYDEEGRVYLVPKQWKPGVENKNRQCLKDLIGCSPDELDALVMAVYLRATTDEGGGYGTLF